VGGLDVLDRQILSNRWRTRRFGAKKFPVTTPTNLAPVSWDRMLRAVEKVRDRLLRAANTLEQAGVPYAVAGGNAVAAWVSRVDEAAVRNTRDVDILLRRSDLEPALRERLNLLLANPEV
jgi:hypothetical protein